MTQKINDGGSAYPISNGRETDFGMSLRDYFAGQALTGVKGWHPADKRGKNVGEICYEIADKMIAALGEGQ